MNREELDEYGARLLAQIALDPEGPASQQFAGLFYPVIWGFLRANHSRLGAVVGGYAGTSKSAAPQLLDEEVDDVAHDATERAIRRLRRNAAKFDPAAGPATKWALGAAGFAFVEEAKKAVTKRTNQPHPVPADPHELEEYGDQGGLEEDMLRRVINEQTYAEVADVLTEREWTALRLQVELEMSCADIARALFNDDTKTRKVEGLLERGKKKLKIAWQDRRPSPGRVKTLNVRAKTDDNGKADE
jgi:DNA-directed RNA polymerase specialized sigma24 family protein